jgi:hypothetical protein
MTDNHSYKGSAFVAGMALANRLAGFKDALDRLGADGGFGDEETERLAGTLRHLVGHLEDSDCWAELSAAVDFYFGWDDRKAAQAAAREASSAQADAQRQRIDVLTAGLECPDCHSGPGDACVTSGGKPVIDGNGMHAGLTPQGGRRTLRRRRSRRDDILTRRECRWLCGATARDPVSGWQQVATVDWTRRSSYSVAITTKPPSQQATHIGG